MDTPEWGRLPRSYEVTSVGPIDVRRPADRTNATPRGGPNSEEPSRRTADRMTLSFRTNGEIPKPPASSQRTALSAAMLRFRTAREFTYVAPGRPNPDSEIGAPSGTEVISGGVRFRTSCPLRLDRAPAPDRSVEPGTLRGARTGSDGLLRGVGRGAINRVVAADRVGVRAANARDALGQELKRGRRPEQRGHRRRQ